MHYAKKSMAFLFCLASTIANAQDVKEKQKTVLCASLPRVISIITREPISEVPVWSGQDGDKKSSYVIFQNSKTGSFTLVQFDDKTACILGEGNSSQLESVRN